MIAGRAVAAIATVLTLAAILSGCAGDQGATTRPMTFHLDAATAGRVSADVPAKPMATVPTSTDGMDFELYVVKRTDAMVQVVFALHNVGDADIDLAYATEDLDENPAVSVHDARRVALVDGTGLKEYKTFIEDGDDSPCLCSHTWTAIGDSGFGPGVRRYYVAEVAAPPASVDQVTVRAGVATVPGVRIEG
ncbi:MAG: hypothetical protein J2P24_13025 [Streptosporangiales bacterium]|nr:hypothetical protein [Streptosporangiales bacterium]